MLLGRAGSEREDSCWRPAIRLGLPPESGAKQASQQPRWGLITEPAQANAIIAKGEADLVFLARAMLRDPYWAVHAAAALGEQYQLAETVSARGAGQSPARTAIDRS